METLTLIKTNIKTLRRAIPCASTIRVKVQRGKFSLLQNNGQITNKYAEKFGEFVENA